MKKNKKKQLESGSMAPESRLKTSSQTTAQSPEDRIRKRAYELHQARGGAPGQELDDWLQAEREIKAENEQPSRALGDAS